MKVRSLLSEFGPVALEFSEKPASKARSAAWRGGWASIGPDPADQEETMGESKGVALGSRESQWANSSTEKTP